MTLDPQALKAAARTYCEVIGLDYDRISGRLAAKRDEATAAAITAYHEVFADRWNMKGIRDGFAGAIDWIRAYRNRTGCALRDAKLAYEAGMPMPPIGAGWQDIRTAPKDGTRVLVWFSYSPAEQAQALEAGRAEAARWSDHCGGWMLDQDAFNENHQPTHWAPLPLPPVGSGPNLADANSKSPIQAREE